ncbi:C1q-related factor-like [Mercenaria mercenaria]|uniref:C1q-related factor-like n=1 Tax=Mercenaria mercenaria TaxID=6596 RepID=UPI00234F0997|nr:C1q-related factor-like [Mercenaria mercenaria]
MNQDVREAVETEVAFYATHSHHDVQHLGQNQIIVFDQAVTNIGNAYNSHHGGFVAPVAGTYVFHVTMMGRNAHAVTGNHFNAYIDVDGRTYSQLWVVPYEQSSQMFIIELSAGKTVTVKNHILDDGFVGQHMSTFSGFLLYEHYRSPAIVGK